MATIKYVKTPDGVTHNIGGGGGTPVTYSISLGAVSSNAVPIILTGSNGTTDTVHVKGGGDATMSVSGDTMTITASSGQTITYTLSGSGTTTTYTITATPSSGTPTSVTIPAATTSAAGLMTDADKTKLDGITAGAEPNVQSDWNENDPTSDAYILNKPTIPSVVPQNLWYGTSSTGASSSAKVATTSGGNFVLSTGNMVRVKFDNSNSYNGTATLNVDGTGAVDIARVGTTKTTRYYWTAGEVVDFVYDGTNFVMSDKGTATTTYYGLTKLSSSTSSTSTSLAATPSAVKAAYDLADSKVSDVEVDGTSVVTGGVASITTTKESIGSASAGTAIDADEITAWSTNTPTQVTKKTVVTGGTTTSFTPVTSKTVVTGVTPATVVTGGTTTSITPVTSNTVVTSASGATATVSTGVLTITDGSFGTGDSVTSGTAVNAYTSLSTGDSAMVTTGDSVTSGTAIDVYTGLTTGDSVDVTAGTAASLTYTSKSIPNISVTSKNVVTDVS